MAIISAVMQIFSSVVDHGIDIGLAGHAAFHHQALPDLLTVKGGLTDEQRAALTRLRARVQERDHIADAPSIAWDPSAKVWMARRRPGAQEPSRSAAR
ncbi:MAG: hypothetical protein U0235_28830 [Polyangiaceae bacterium]